MNDWGIRARVILLALIPTAIVATVMGAYFISSRVQDLSLNLQERGITIANYLSQTSEYSLISRNNKTLTRLVTSARDGDDDILAIAIYSKGHLLLASSGTKELVAQLASTNNQLSMLSQIESNEHGFIIKSSITSQPTISQHTTYQSQTDIPIIGYVAVLITNKNIKLRQYQTIITAVIILIIGLLLSGVLAKKMARNITLPIIQLANAVKRIKEGQLRVSIESNSSGELKTLVNGFNDMSDSLYEAREEMQMAIEQATADINATNTALEEQNVELNIAKKEAIEASRVKSEFLANMSHEIRTPMNGVIGFTNLLLRTPISDKQKDYLSTIKKSASSLLSIIDNILDFSKIEAGKMQMENLSFKISDCVDETLKLLAPAAQAKNIEILGVVYQDVPQYLKGDAGRVCQILTNLCNNAIKFTKLGTIQIRVLLEEEKSSSVTLKIRITDTGVGLSKKQQKVLFQAFTQADTTTTRRFGGTGLGLVISKKLAESMNGKIGLESKENIGSTFWFTIQLEKDLDATEKSVLGFPGRKILLHDLNNTSQMATKFLLEQWGATVETCKSLNALVNQVEERLNQQKTIHLIIISGYTPQNDDKLLTQLINHSKKANTPLLTLINTQDDKEIKQFTDFGLNYIFSKPLTKDIFYKDLLNWLGIEKTKLITSPSLLSHHKELNILCVDDNEANLKLINAFLSDFNVKTQIVDSGRKAIQLCENNSFDLIFMDIQMPEMDGLEATQAIRNINKQFKATPIIALTAHAMKGEKERLLKEGMDDYLTKPISQTQLQENIQKWTKKEVVFTQPPPPLYEQLSSNTIKLSIDWELSLKNAGQRDDLARDMLRMLVKSFDEAKKLMLQHLKDGRLSELLTQVHKLHGATAYCGVPELKKLANQYESQLKTDGINSDSIKLQEAFISEIKNVEVDAIKILSK